MLRAPIINQLDLTDYAVIDAAAIKIRRRLVSCLFILQVLATIDRYNIGFAALSMNAALGLTPAMFGFGAGVFFWGYFLFEIPSSMMLSKVGARRWLARILLTWGIVVIWMSAVTRPAHLYLLRFVLGASEAGFLPGMLVYIARWIPRTHRAATVARLSSGFLVASIVGGPVAGLILRLHGLGGISGWQWLFVCEGIPAVVAGLLVLKYLPERPADVKWLTAREKQVLQLEVESERSSKAMTFSDLGVAMGSWRVWTWAAIEFAITAGLYGVNFWLPQIMKKLSNFDTVSVGFLSAIPYIIGLASMLLVANHSDRRAERRWHIFVPYLLGGAALACAGVTDGMVLSVTLIALTMVTYGGLPPFWALVTSDLTGPAAPTGIAAITSLGALAGFAGPFLLGYVTQATGSTSGALAVLGALMTFGASSVFFVKRPLIANGSARS